MKSFAEFTDKPRQNLHLDHIDESHFINGTDGATNALNSLQSLLEGNGVFVTEKWDGAPAVFAGTDPSDGKFFIATKSVFNKQPKLYKSINEIVDGDMPAGLMTKLSEVFYSLYNLGIPTDTVLQGDLLWSSRNDQQYRTYEGKRYVTVHPNTLIYGWEHGTPEALQVERANVGIVFHTTYRGQGSLQNYQATFGANVSALKESHEVWVRDAQYGKSVFSEEHYSRISEILDAAESTNCDYDAIAEIMRMIPEAFSGARIQSFYNSQIRQGLYPYDAAAYFKHIQDYYAKQMDKVKTDAAKDKRKVQLKQLMDIVKGKEKVFHNAFYYTSKINEAKLEVIHELNSRNKQVIFAERADGTLIKQNPEGYVIVDMITGTGMKLVDREAFSYMNFSEDFKKGWQK